MLSTLQHEFTEGHAQNYLQVISSEELVRDRVLTTIVVIIMYILYNNNRYIIAWVHNGPLLFNIFTRHFLSFALCSAVQSTDILHDEQTIQEPAKNVPV